MANIWNYFNKEGRSYWCNKINTLRFWKMVTEGKKFIIFDLETTGLKKASDAVVEFSAIVMEKVGNIYEKTETVEYYIKPPFLMPEAVIAVHGITNEFLEDKPTESEVWPQIYDFFERHKDSVISGYNVSYDIKFTKEMAKRNKYEFEPQDFLDVFSLVKENIFSDEHDGNRRLADITSLLFPGQVFQFHDSSEDILATWKVGVEILKRFVNSKPSPESDKPKASIISYEAKSFGKGYFIFVTVKVQKEFFDLYYSCYQSCWIHKNDGEPCFDFFDMDDFEEKLNEIAIKKGKKHFHLLRDKDSFAA